MLSQAAKAEAAEMGKSGNGNNVGMIDRDLYKEQLLRGLLNICTLQHSLVTCFWFILAGSDYSFRFRSLASQRHMYRRRSYVAVSQQRS